MISRGNVVVTGSLTTSGSLTTTGTITATTLVVQTITSSISSITGSTNFGSLSSNNHVFTGSLNVTGSLSVVTTGTEFQVTNTGVNLGNTLTDSHVISGSLRVNPNGLFVSGSGRVGINTTNPLSLLDVNVLASGARRLLVNYDDSLVTIKSANDSATAESLRVWGDNIYFYTGSAGSELMRLTNTGRVGIGTTSPTSILDVKGTGTYDFISISNGSTSGGGGILTRQNATASSWFGNSGGWEGGTSNDTGIGSYAGGIRFYTAGGTEKMRITSAGVVDLPYGQIKFPASQNASADANTLDDYEEGTWTPVIGGSGGQSGQNYTGQSGYYTKIGRQVTVTFRVVLSLKGTITGDAAIKGLPFTIDSTISFGNGATFFEGLATSWYSIFFVCNGGSTFASIDGLKAAGTTSTRATTSDIANNTQFNGSFTYFV
jgi:hypothetical protein